jgi:hypothetical protein
MTSRRPLLLVLFVLELPRLALMLAVLGGSSESAVAFASPQALFALTAFFAWFAPDRYQAFVPLYAAGKTVSAVALGAWVVGAAPELLTPMNAAESERLLGLAAAAYSCLFDAVSAALTTAAALSAAKKADRERRESLPPLVIDDIPEESGGA